MQHKPIITADEAVRLIGDRSSLIVEGSGGGLLEPNLLLERLEQRFLEEGSPRNLTVIHCTGIGDRKTRGIGHLAHKGLVERVIAGNWAMAPGMGKLALDEEIEAYNFPQGVMSRLLREIAAGMPGMVTRAGLETFVDPRYEGGKLNARTKEDLVKLVEIEGEQFLYYRRFPIHFAFLRATTADEEGNLTIEEEGARLELLSMAQATRNAGGTVIVQVKRIVKAGTLPASQVVVPGILVDYIVHNPDQVQTYESDYNPSFSGHQKIPLAQIKPMELNERKIVARRAMMELRPGQVVNLGVGMADGVANVAAEEGLLDQITLTIEQGIVGGIPAQGLIFGVSYNPAAIIDQPYQFDFYHGGGLDVTCLGCGEIDQEGNVNVSRLGDKLIGTGGFIDISQNARKVVFCGTFTTGGLEVSCRDGKLAIVQEGRHSKFVNAVKQITFSGRYARSRGQEVMYVTERAVFRSVPEGLMLVEIAPGIDLQRDVLDRMPFRPLLPPDGVKLMDPRIFRPERLNGFSASTEAPNQIDND
jgi:acyl CoA:acetate/3-ketoacid CoA transferase